MMVAYETERTVLDAARDRIAAVFDKFPRVVVSVSGGKDSTVLRHLAVEEAARRGRRIGLFFLDQEAEYQATIDVVTEWMADPRVDPAWYQVPVRMTNATSHRDYWLNAWGDGEAWMRPKHPLAIQRIDGAYPDRFYEFFPWVEAQDSEPTAHLVGLRSRESFNRFRSVTKCVGCHGWRWSTATDNPHSFRCYPLFDWATGDVWRYIAEQGLTYNRHYDRMFAKYGPVDRKMRVSNLIHEKSFRCLADLQEFEPDTYDALVRRVGGPHAAALYYNESGVFEAKDLPPAFSTWKVYRDYLVASTPLDRVERFRQRFAGQRDDEETCRQQVKQVLLNDFENAVPVSQPKRNRLRERLWDKL